MAYILQVNERLKKGRRILHGVLPPGRTRAMAMDETIDNTTSGMRQSKYQTKGISSNGDIYIWIIFLPIPIPTILVSSNQYSIEASIMVLSQLGPVTISKARFEIIMLALSAVIYTLYGGAGAGWTSQRNKTQLISDFERTAFNIRHYSTCLLKNS